MAYVAIPAASSSGGSGSSTQAAWFASTLARIQTYDATLTDVVVAEEMGVTGIWPTVVVNNGTVTGAGSALDLQSGTTSGGLALLQTSLNITTNIRTGHWAVAFRMTKIATIATSQNYATISDGVGVGTPKLGMFGATSTTNYTVKCGTAAAIDTTVAQSAVGTYDTLIMLGDGTNMKIDINGAAPGAGASQAIGTLIVAAGGVASFVATQTAVANSGIRIDKSMVVVPVAA